MKADYAIVSCFVKNITVHGDEFEKVIFMSQRDNDKSFMHLALKLAEQGRGWTSPNPMVGAVIVREGQVVGKGFHQYAGGPHAEVYAIKEAGELAQDATLYVTLEPCNHSGRTPPCTEAIHKSGIKRVVAAMLDPNPNVRGGGLKFLQGLGIDIEAGVCEDECRLLNEAFIKYVTTGLPFVILKCAMSLDGRIGTRTGDSKWITCARSRQYVHELRHAVDAVVVGIGTVLRDDPELTTRLVGRHGADPLRVVLDTHLSIPENARLLHVSSASDTVLVTGSSVPSEKRKSLEKPGTQILPIACADNRIDLHALMLELGKMQISSVLIEGGAQVNKAALDAGIVDKVCLFYAPKIYGGADGVAVFSGEGASSVENMTCIHNTTVHRFDEDIMIEGYLDPKRIRDGNERLGLCLQDL